jgi:hypothetical protein
MEFASGSKKPPRATTVSTSIVLLEDGRIGDLSTFAVKAAGGWRGRVIFQPAGSIAEIVDCTEVDPTMTLAQTRAEVLAVTRFPQADPRLDEPDQAA